ncbi:hypothetical protein [Paraburkholderia youngii]|uniref:hypothetical protein n=1 Tax=Paraburkholderia youngii TaxID=2782701 RepID=UPI003D25723C
MSSKARDDKQPENAHFSSFQQWLDTATLIVLTITVIVTAVGIFVVHRDSDEALKTAQGTAHDALAKATEANKIAEEALKSVQRAFINVDEVQVAQRIDGPPLFSPIILNNGATPALIKSIVAIDPNGFCTFNTTFGSKAADVEAAFIIGAPSDPDLVASIPAVGPLAVDPTLRNVVLGPHGTIKPALGRGSGSVAAKDFLRPYVNARILKFLYGVILYNDTFGHPHKTKYCYRVLPAQQIHEPNPALVVNRCTHWNCADELCEADKKAYDDQLAAWRRDVTNQEYIREKTDCWNWHLHGRIN